MYCILRECIKSIRTNRLKDRTLSFSVCVFNREEGEQHRRNRSLLFLPFVEKQLVYAAWPWFLKRINVVNEWSRLRRIIGSMFFLPVRADSIIPNGLSKLKKASTRVVFPLISTIMLFSLTSTIFAPNCSASTLMDCKCWCFNRRASAGVNGGGNWGWWVVVPDLCSKFSAMKTSCSKVREWSSTVAAGSGCAKADPWRGSCVGPPTSWASR